MVGCVVLNAPREMPPPLRRLRTDIRPPLGNLTDNSTVIQPLPNRAQTVGDLNLSATVLQPQDNHFPSILQPSPICRARVGATALDNLVSICARLPTGAGGSPFASRWRDTPHRPTFRHSTALHLLCTHHHLTHPPRRLSSTVLQPPHTHLPTFLQPSSNRRALFAHGRTSVRISAASRTIQPLYNRSPTATPTILQPYSNHLPTATHTLLARPASHLPRQGRTSSSLPRRRVHSTTPPCACPTKIWYN